jgi:hypothetical protein
VREGLPFHGLFYGLRIFGCKTAPFYPTRRESASLWFAPKNNLRNVLKAAQKVLFELQISRSGPTELCRRSHTKAVFSELIKSSL